MLYYLDPAKPNRTKRMAIPQHTHPSIFELFESFHERVSGAKQINDK
jgi:hypothetical protein